MGLVNLPIWRTFYPFGIQLSKLVCNYFQFGLFFTYLVYFLFVFVFVDPIIHQMGHFDPIWLTDDTNWFVIICKYYQFGVWFTHLADLECNCTNWFVSISKVRQFGILFTHLAYAF
jgi:hypothetical protein